MKTKRQKRILILLLVFAMTMVYGIYPSITGVKAESIINASDTISDSDLGETATHDLDFQTVIATPAGGYIEVAFLSTDWGTIGDDGDIACPGGGTASRQDSNRTARCTYGAGVGAGVKEITIADVTNSATSSTYYLEISNRNSSDVVLEYVTVAVRIIEDILMTATVESTLVFNITGTTTDAVVNGVGCDAVTTATATPFGTLEVNTAKTICQDLYVTTNADDGYIVTVEQDGELTSDSGSNINSFRDAADGTGLTVPEPWGAAPANTLDSYNTYGHMGLTSSDSDLDSFAYNDYYNGGGDAQYVGLDGTDPVVIMHHDGPSDGATQDKGFATVAYTAEIGSLQEAGDYESTLTYICTPTY